MTVPPAHPSPVLSLYCDDRELHRRLAPHMGWDAFKAAIRTCEQSADFPRVSELWRGRFFPAVEAWFLKHNGMVFNVEPTPAPSDQDGRENFGAAARRTTGPQDRPQQPAVLDRQAGRHRPDEFPGHVHRLARPGR